MQYRLLGNSGVRVSALCLGTAFFGIAPRESDALALVQRALDRGINFIDTSNSYGNQTRFDRPGVPPAAQRPSSEELVGRAVKGRRHDVVLATKVQEKVGEGPNDGGPTGGGLTRKHIVAQCERSLQRLGTDYIDVYYAHHPDPTTPLEQTLRAFDDLVRQGKVRYPALSNFAGWQLTRAMWIADSRHLNPPIAMEMPYSLLDRQIERDVVPACLEFGVGITAYSPLAAGLLAGRYASGTNEGETATARFRPGHTFPPQHVAAAARVADLARTWSESAACVSLAWLLSRPALVSAIVGPETVAQLEELLPAADLHLADEQRRLLEAATV